MISSLNIKQTDFQFEEAYTDGQLNSILDRLNSKIWIWSKVGEEYLIKSIEYKYIIKIKFIHINFKWEIISFS